VCKLIHEKASELCGTRSASHYRIFVWNRQPQNCQFQITVDEVTVFLKHVTQWRPLKSLTLFGLDTLTPSWPDLGDVDLFNKAKVFHLPLLPNPLPGSQDAFYQARSWLSQCQKNHGECFRPPSLLPMRVVDLEFMTERQAVALYISDREPQPYVALSYSCGETDRLTSVRNLANSECSPNQLQSGSPYIIKQLRRNADQSKHECISTWSPDSIPLHVFPKTQIDALTIAQTLGFRYIWIDSLCIIQVDNHDWATQGADMTNIYGRSTLTISASNGQTSEDGMLDELQNNRFTLDHSGIKILQRSLSKFL
jgi:heterokaryon incompatibility protein (HET)